MKKKPTYKQECRSNIDAFMQWSFLPPPFNDLDWWNEFKKGLVDTMLTLVETVRKILLFIEKEMIPE